MTEIKKLDTLGDHGVNLEKNPLAHIDGEFAKAQNWVPFHEEGQHGIRRRAGLQLQNTSTLSGSVAGFIGVPLPAPNELVLAVADRLGSSAVFSLKASVDSGVSWDDVTPDKPTTISYLWPALNSVAGGVGTGRIAIGASGTLLAEIALAYKGVAYLPASCGSGGNERAILVWQKDTPVSGNAQDGTLFELFRLPSSIGITAFWRAGSVLYVGGLGTGGFGNYVYRLNRGTGAYTLLAIGTTFTPGTEDLFSGAGYIGRQWVGTSRATQGRIHYWREGDTTWTTERTAAANLHCYPSMAVYRGNLYAATMALAGTAAIIEQRLPDGTWSTSLTGSHSVQANYFDCLWVHQDRLYAAYMTRGATDVCHIYQFDGSSWVVDEDMDAKTTTPSYVWGFASLGEDLFVHTADESSLNPRVWKRDSGGVYTSVLSGQVAVDGPLLVV